MENTLQKRCTRFVMVRHGQSTFNAERRFQGRSNEAELTALGYSTAASCAEKLSGIRFDAILASPLRRARQTAGEIGLCLAGRSGEFPRVLSEPLLREIHVPVWEGLTLDEIQAAFPAEFETWQSRPHLLEIPAALQGRHAGKNFRPIELVFEQAKRFWGKVLGVHAGECVLAVSHAGAIRALILTALNAPWDRFPVLQQSNGGISVLHFNDGYNAPADLVCFNQTNQPGESLPKAKKGKRGLRLVLSTGERQWPGVQLLRTPRPGRGILDLADLQRRALISHDHAGLVTRGAMVGDADLRAFLADSLGLDRGDASRFRVNPEAFTIFHYAQPGGPPVLQAMNILPATE